MIAEIRGPWRTLTFLVAALCLSWGAAACFAQQELDDLKALRKERRARLSELASDMMNNRVAFHFSFHELVQAERKSFKADLDYSDKPEEKIEAIEEHQEAADSLVALAEVRLRLGSGRTFDVSRAKAYSLEVQIELLKEKRKQRK